MKHRRCRYFDYYGLPIHGGCGRTSDDCFFAHPGDPEWDELDSRLRRSPPLPDPLLKGTRPPPPLQLQIGQPSGSISEASATLYNRVRAKESPVVEHRAFANPFAHSQAVTFPLTPKMNIDQFPSIPSAPPTRDPRRAPRAQDQAAASTSMITPTSSRDPSTPRPQSATPTITQIIPTAPRAFFGGSTRTVSGKHPRPPTYDPPPMPPLPPPPELPEALDSRPGQPEETILLSERSVSWSKRITQVADLADLKKELKKRQTDVDHMHALSQNLQRFGLSMVEKQHLHDRISLLEHKRDGLSTRCTDERENFISPASWSVTPKLIEKGKMNERLQSAFDVLKEIYTNAKETQQLVADVTEEGKKKSSGSRMVDAEGRPAKRMRTSSNAAPNDLEDDDMDIDEEEEYPELEVLDDTLDNLERLSGDLSSVRDDMTQHDNNLRAQIYEVLEKRLEAMLEEDDEAGKVILSHLKELRAGLAEEGVKKMDDCHRAMAKLSMESESLDARLDVARANQDSTKERLRTLFGHIQTVKSDKGKLQNCHSAIESALDSYRAQPPLPIDTPDTTSSLILQRFAGQIVNQLLEYQHTQPTMQSLLTNVTSMLQAENNEMVKLLSEKLAVTEKTVHLIHTQVKQ